MEEGCPGPAREARILRGGEYPFVGAAVEGELVTVSAHEHGAPGAPVLF
jgi:hypothetical protein